MFFFIAIKQNTRVGTTKIAFRNASIPIKFFLLLFYLKWHKDNPYH